MDARLVKRLCLWSIGGTTLVFALALASVFFHRRDQLISQAVRDAKSDLYKASSLIGDRLEIARTAVINSALPDSHGDSRRIVENLLDHNSDIYGSAIALKPEYAQKYCHEPRFMVYSYRTPADTLCTFKVDASHDQYFQYPERDWFSYPARKGLEHWTGPYHDSLTNGALMVSFSAPITLPDSTVIGVMLADITLQEGITRIVEEVDSTCDHHTYLLSREGTLVFGDTTGMANALVYTQTLPLTGWTLGHVIDKETMFSPLRKEMFNMAVLFLLTVGILCVTIYYTISWMTRPAVKRQMRIKAELDVAANIQQGMLPKTEPPFPGRGDELDVATVMQPAKEVGGDFYNYFLEGDRLYFIIGDVSGKGVPAALIMAIATELFMFSAPGKTDPADIVDDINRMLCRDNEENMFVTMIVGILDLSTQKLRLCNAGHNLPVVITSEGDEILKLATNIPTGVIGDYPYASEEFDFRRGSKLVLYTDGVTEAENALHRQFDMTRLMQVIRAKGSRDARGLRDAIEEALHTFTSGQEQSDDITLFILHFLH